MHTSAIASTGIIALLAVSFTARASNPDYLSSEQPVEKSVLEVEGSFGTMAPVEEEIPGPERRITRIRNFLWRDASLLLKPRSYYFDRQRDDAADHRQAAESHHQISVAVERDNPFVSCHRKSKADRRNLTH